MLVRGGLCGKVGFVGGFRSWWFGVCVVFMSSFSFREFIVVRYFGGSWFFLGFLVLGFFVF